MATDPELLDALMAAATGYKAAGSGAAAGVLAGECWPEFLTLLAAAIQADGLVLALIAPEGVVQSWTFGAPAGVPDAADIARMRMDRVYSQVDLPGAGVQTAPLRALRCPVPGIGHMVLFARRTGLASESGASDFRAIDSARLSGLGRRIAWALASWHALREERALAGLDRKAARALGVGWLLLGPVGQVLATAPQMDSGLIRRAGLRLRAGGRIEGLHAELAAAIQAALSGVPPVARSVISPTAPGDAALCMSVQGVDHLRGPALILWIRGTAPLRGMPAALLAQAFGISTSEARLAACIADGQSLAEAARDLGWTIQTARSCSKGLYARLGVRGQTGVALALHASPLGL